MVISQSKFSISLVIERIFNLLSRPVICAQLQGRETNIYISQLLATQVYSISEITHIIRNSSNSYYNIRYQYVQLYIYFISSYCNTCIRRVFFKLYLLSRIALESNSFSSAVTQPFSHESTAFASPYSFKILLCLVVFPRFVVRHA